MNKKKLILFCFSFFICVLIQISFTLLFYDVYNEIVSLLTLNIDDFSKLTRWVIEKDLFYHVPMITVSFSVIMLLLLTTVWIDKK